MIRVADYIAKKLTQHGIRDIFMISGGGAMYLNDAVGKCPRLRYICNHHEQASAIGAEGYARIKNDLAVVIITSGPGGTNTLTGVIGQWLDSVPVLYISGQVKYETTIASAPKIGLRQLGDQEINIIDIVKPITKYAVMINDPETIRYHLEKAIYLAKSARPGPVWLDIPLNIQGSLVEENNLKGFVQKPAALQKKDLKIGEVAHLISQSSRPVFIFGRGVLISNARELALQLAEKLGVPVVSTFNAADLIPTDHYLHIGRIGTVGSRAGNFALQNADLIISIGSRNNIRQISYSWKYFARSAKKIVVDIDPAELKKPTIQPDIAINADAKKFIKGLLDVKINLDNKKLNDWLFWCQERKKNYPPFVEKKENPPIRGVSLYQFFSFFTSLIPENKIMIAGNGSACVGLFQAGIIKKGQRVFWNSGCASMGYDLPAAIGACFGANKKETYCFAGDGSLQMNIQELQTVAHHHLPIKIIYLNNSGYVSIKQTQNAFFSGCHVACDSASGVSFPNIKKIAAAYGLPYFAIKNKKNLAIVSKKVITHSGPLICEVILPSDYAFAPKLSSEKKQDGKIISKSLEDLYPFLPRDEFKKNMITPIIEEDL